MGIILKTIIREGEGGDGGVCATQGIFRIIVLKLFRRKSS